MRTSDLRVAKHEIFNFQSFLNETNSISSSLVTNSKFGLYLYPFANQVFHEKGPNKLKEVLDVIFEALDFLEKKVFPGSTALLLKLPVLKWIIIGKFTYKFIIDIHKLLSNEEA